MRPRAFLMAVAIVAATSAACRGRETSDVAAAGALPAVRNPIGPIPGGGKPREQAANPFGSDAEVARQGRQLFVVMNCSGCHGGRAGGGMGPSLRDQDWIYGSSPAEIFSSIAQGRAHGMPAWGTRLPDQSIWMLVTYVQSLRTAHEPDAPR
jgi:cytochrome c oxidase cbb3-type subunit III